MSIFHQIVVNATNSHLRRSAIGVSALGVFDLQRKLVPSLGALLVVISGTFVSHTHAVELIDNGNFEADGRDLGPLLTGWGDAGSGANNKGFGIQEWPYFENGEFVAGNVVWEFPPGDIANNFTGTLRPNGAGDFFGFRWGVWNGTGFEGSATQHVDLTPHAGHPFEFSAWLASADRDTDHAVVSLEFYTGANATGTSLGSISFDGNDQQSPFIVGSLNLDGFADPFVAATQDNWTFYGTTGRIPLQTESAAVVIRSIDVPGIIAGDDAYVDLVSLRVVPEPGTAALACVVGMFGVMWWIRRTT